MTILKCEPTFQQKIVKTPRDARTFKIFSNNAKSKNFSAESIDIPQRNGRNYNW